MDDLNTPLAGPKATRRLTIPVSAPQLLAGVLAASLAAFVAWAVLVEDPLGGEPIVIASIPVQGTAKSTPDHAKPATAPLQQDAEKPSRYDGPSQTAPAVPNGKTVTIIDGTSGKRQEVVIPGAQERPPAAAAEADVDEALLEGTRHGRIPKVVTSGARALDRYARTAGPAESASKGPKVAIVVGGLGIGASATADALSRLPPAITFGFIPYGANLSDLAARARSRGHEVLLQVSMEPFDYPDNDPGPQALLSTLPNEQNLDRLHWQMSRFQGYVGVMNLMGGRFMTSEKVLAPVLSDVAKRGLLFVDDGTSARSLAGHLATAGNMPFVKGEEVLDAVPTPAEIDRALSRLEAAARKNGIAVGIATALPVSIDRIVRWAKGAETRGVTLVGVTVAALKPRSS